jgi:hypothetical protein
MLQSSWTRVRVYVCLIQFTPGWWFGTMEFYFPYIGNFIILTDFHSIIFQKGRSTTNQTLILRSESIRCQSIRQAVEPGHIFWVAPSGGRDRRPCYGGWGPAQNGPKRTGELTVNRGKPNKAPTLEGFESHFFGIGEGLWHWVYHISYPSKCG